MRMPSRRLAVSLHISRPAATEAMGEIIAPVKRPLTGPHGVVSRTRSPKDALGYRTSRGTRPPRYLDKSAD